MAQGGCLRRLLGMFFSDVGPKGVGGGGLRGGEVGEEDGTGGKEGKERKGKEEEGGLDKNVC